MEVSRIRALRGPNLWSRHTAIEAVVTLTPAECDLSQLPGFVEQLRQRFPQIGALPRPSAQASLSLAHALERATLALIGELRALKNIIAIYDQYRKLEAI